VGKQKKFSLGIVDDIQRSWNMNKKIVAFYVAAMITTLYLTYGILLEYPEMSPNLFWTIVRIVFLTYIISAFGLLVKQYGVITDVVMTKLKEDSIRTRDIVESHIQWVAAKPDQAEAAIESLHNTNIWVSTNTQVKLLEEIEKLHKTVQKQEAELKKLSKKKRGKIEE
jgi:hypothetical protein